MTDLRITGFYPPHYLNSKDEQINAVIDLCSAYFTLFENDIESFLQKLTLTEGVDPEYAQMLCDFLQVTYIEDTCFQFMKAKKTPTNAITLYQNFLQVFPFLEKIDPKTGEIVKLLTITEDDNKKSIYILINTYDKYKKETDKVIYQLMMDFYPFLKTYLPLIIPVGLQVKIDIQYALTWDDFVTHDPSLHISNLLEHTMEEIQKWEQIPTI